MKEQNKTSTTVQIADAHADKWRDLKEQFRELAEKEARDVPIANDRLWAFCSHAPHIELEPREYVEAPWEKLEHAWEKLPTGPFCPLKVPASGTWWYEAKSSDWSNYESFRVLATNAGRTLGCPDGVSPETFWLHCVYTGLRRHEAKKASPSPPDAKNTFLFGDDNLDAIVCVCGASVSVFEPAPWKQVLIAVATDATPGLQAIAELVRPAEAADAGVATPAAVEAQSSGKTGMLSREVTSRAARLDLLLQAKGWSVNDWAQQANVDFHTAADFRNGKTAPRTSTLKKLADALGCSITDLPV